MAALRRGTTLTDLLIVVFALAMACALAVPALHKSREYAFRIKCGTNLRNLGAAMLAYAQANGGDFPRTTYVPGAPLAQYTGSAAPDPFAAGGPAPNDVTAPFYLLVRVQSLEPQVLVCPTTDALVPWDLGGKPAAAWSNLPGGRHLGYSIANPYPDAAAVNKGYRWDWRLGAEFAIAADMNPGGAALTRMTAESPPKVQREGNTLNEAGRAGQLVLYGDGHAEFQQTPFVGTRRDNVYTVAGSDDGTVPGGSVIWGSPAWAGDSVLLPVATVDPKGQFPPWEIRERREMIARGVLWSIVTAVVLAIGVLAVRRMRRPAAR